MKYVVRFFRYIEPMWLGHDNKLSIRRFLALMFSVNLMMSTYHIIRNWEADKSYSDAALILGIEAGLIAALLSLTTYSNALLTKNNPNTPTE
jgi:hypothetical protein